MSRADSDILHLGCGEDYHTDAWNVDAIPAVEPDEVYNLDELPWPWESESWGVIRAYHVFEHLDDIEGALRETARLLRPGGFLELKLPMGIDAVADPDHSWGDGHPWTYRTPEYYTGKRHWDVDVGLRVYNRDCDVYSVAPRRFKRGFMQLIWEWRKLRSGVGRWCFALPQMGGEFTVIFKKPNHDG